MLQTLQCNRVLASGKVEVSLILLDVTLPDINGLDFDK